MGSSSQSLFDIFWMWSTTKTSADMVSALNHFLITPASSIADSAMNVNYGFPLNVWLSDESATEYAANDGALALSVGLKIFIAEGTTGKPVADYYGFWTPMMTPFFKATGNNEIDVVVNTDRAV